MQRISHIRHLVVGFSMLSALSARAEVSPKVAGSTDAVKAPVFAAAVKAINTDYVKEINSASPDPAKLARMYTEDAVVVYPRSDLIVGRPAIEAAYKLAGKNVGKLSLQTIKLTSEGTLGYEIGTFKDTITDRAGKAVPVSGTYLTVWEQQPNGSWLMAANSSMNVTEAPEFSGSTATLQTKRKIAPLGGDAGEKVDQLRSIIASSHSKFVAAVNGMAAARKVDKIQLDSLTSLYTPDATIMLPGRKPIRGGAAIGSFFKTTAGAVSDLSLSTLRVRNQGRLAYEVGSLSNVTKDAKGEGKPVDGYYLMVWQQSKPVAGVAATGAEPWQMVASADTDLLASPVLASRPAP